MAKRPNAPKDVTTRAAKASAAQKAATKSGPERGDHRRRHRDPDDHRGRRLGIINQKATSDARAGGTAIPAGASVDSGYRAFADVTPLAAGAPVVDLFEGLPVPGLRATRGRGSARLLSRSPRAARSPELPHCSTSSTRFGVKYSVPVANGAFCAADQGQVPGLPRCRLRGSGPKKPEHPDRDSGQLRHDGQPDWRGPAPQHLFVEVPYYVGQTDAAVQAKVSGTPTVKITRHRGTLKDVAPPTA